MAERDTAPRKSARSTGRRDSGARPAPQAEPDTGTREAPADKALNVKIDGAIAERAMNAFFGARQHSRWRDFLEDAVAEYTAKMEQEHNDGEPFPQRPSETLTRGRKVGVSPKRAESR